MIEIAIKIAQKPNNEGIAIAFVPTFHEPTTVSEQVYASLVHKIMVEVVSPALNEFTNEMGGESAILTGDKAIFLADQMGFLGDAPQDPEKN